jgi:glycosyltransferase involved in cell wall biosynthesis
MSLTILNVAYPFARVGRDAVGGAEQVLSEIDRGLVEAGHRSIVIAAAGSATAGILVSVPFDDGPIDEARRQTAWQRHRDAIVSALRRWPVDLVHLHGVDFDRYLPPAGTPTLITLHLPPGWYWPRSLAMRRPGLWLHGVSQAQHATLPSHPALLTPIGNGVPVEALQARHAKRRFALLLARICPEKGIHLALEAAHRAKMPLLIAGQVFAYPEHQRYFAEKVAPLLDRERRLIGPVGFARKRRLLNAAQCLLVPSLAPETSSLVAMEALACGTPVVAMNTGALPEVLEHGRTGILVASGEEMAEAMQRAPQLDPALCRETAQRRFSRNAMVAHYLARYAALRREAQPVAAAS